MTIVWPDNTADITDEIRDAIGRDITIYRTVSGIPCPDPTDSLDPVTNLSTNQFCPTCSGVYWINTASGLVVTAHIIDKALNTPLWQAGGFIVEGDITAQIKYTVASIDAVENSSHFVVDEKEFIMKSFLLRGVPIINRIIISLLKR